MRLIIWWVLLPVGEISPGDKRPGTPWGSSRAFSWIATPRERLGGLPGRELGGQEQKLKLWFSCETSAYYTCHQYLCNTWTISDKWKLNIRGSCLGKRKKNKEKSLWLNTEELHRFHISQPAVRFFIIQGFHDLTGAWWRGVTAVTAPKSLLCTWNTEHYRLWCLKMRSWNLECSITSNLALDHGRHLPPSEGQH